MERIDSNNVEDVLGLSFMQEGMLFFYIENKESNVYHEVMEFELNGYIEEDLFEKSWKYVTRNNEVLRTLYRYEGLTKPVAIVLKKYDIPIKFIDISGDIRSVEILKQICYKLKQFKIDIQSTPFLITLIKESSVKYRMIINFHHILLDGWSMGVILKELLENYKCLVKGKMPAISSKGKYKDYIWASKNIDFNESKKFWKKYLLKDSVTKISGNKKHEDIDDVIQYEVLVPQIINERIPEICNELQVTKATFFYSAWGILLSRYCNSNVIQFGTTVSGRTLGDVRKIEEIVGLFINTVPFCIRLDEKQSIKLLLKKVNRNLVDRKEYEVNSISDVKRYAGQTGNLFDSVLVIENYPVDLVMQTDAPFNINLLESVESTNFDITLQIVDFSQRKVKIIANRKLYTESFVEKLLNHYVCICCYMVEHLERTVQTIEIMDDFEKKHLLCELQTTKRYQVKNLFLSLFKKCVEIYGEKEALIYGSGKMLYNELDDKSDYLAFILREKGIHKNDIVAVYLSDSIEVYISIIGILKAGAAFMPISEKYPIDRIRYMLADSKSKCMISHSKICKESFKCEILYLDKLNDYPEPMQIVLPRVNGSDLAYVIYTSGTTGVPKGIMIPHDGLANVINWYICNFNLISEEKTVKYADFGFDASVWEIFPYLSVGATIYGIENEVKIDMRKMNDFLEEKKISIMFLPTAICEIFMETVDNHSLTRLLTGGDTLRKYVKRRYTLYNNYGPTENTVVSTSGIVDKNNITIGKPIDGVRVYILNDSLQLQPVGVYGEIFISGDSLAKGYINEELTQKLFIDNPYEKGNKMYCTGDIGRWNEQGEIEYLRRKDSQVKIRGYRIELKEIEQNILKYDIIEQAAVVVKAVDSEKRIFGYYVSDKQVNISDLKGFLRAHMPEYMIPFKFYRLADMPLNNSGKIDYEILAGIKELTEESSQYETGNVYEETVAEIWKQILGNVQFSIEDSFFDVGGNSLLLIKMKEKITEKYPDSFEISDLFSYITIRAIAQRLMELESIGQEIFPSKLPNRFYYIGNLNSGARKLQFSIEQGVFRKLEKFTDENKILEDTLLLFAFIYLLKLINEQDEVCIQTLNSSNQLINLKYVFTEDSKIEQVLEDLSEMKKQRNIIIFDSQVSFRREHLYILFAKNKGNINSVFYDNYDLVFAYKKTENRYSFVVTVSEKMDVEIVKNMISDYMSIIKQIINY